MDNDANQPGVFSVYSAARQERIFLEKEKEAHSELFAQEIFVEDANALRLIGIDAHIFGERPRGHIKCFPEDFIVEEITRDGLLHTVDDEGGEDVVTRPREEGEKTVWADLVKIGVDTVRVVEEISTRLGIDKKFIGVAGIKDRHALTAQSVSIRHVRPEEIDSLAAPNFFFKNVRSGKGMRQVGDLSGNRFTIFVRTSDVIDPLMMKEKVGVLAEQGFWNFFYLQRFGTPRLITHLLGRLILQERYEEAVKMSLTFPSPHEIGYFLRVREKILSRWGDWKGILEELRPFTFSFGPEKKMVAHLQAHPHDFIGALCEAPEQVRLDIYAYASFLFNGFLSHLIQQEEDIPLTLPLALNTGTRAKALYGDILAAEGISYPFQALKNFPFISRSEKEVDILKKFTLHGVACQENAVVLDFSLDKGSYATTFLSHFFELSSGERMPDEFSRAEIDTKKVLGKGSLDALKKGKFETFFSEREKIF